MSLRTSQPFCVLSAHWRLHSRLCWASRMALAWYCWMQVWPVDPTMQYPLWYCYQVQIGALGAPLVWVAIWLQWQ
jgi:hypothetical protein